LATLSGGIIGLPNAGKSTVFNALTKGAAAVASYPFCTVSPNVGVVPVPDPRLKKLAELVNPEVVTPATIEVVDVAGLIKGAHKGEGLGNEFLSRIRGVDVLIQVVRCFDARVPHPEGSIDPVRDVETIKIELFLSDLDIVHRRLTRLNKLLKSPIKKDEKTVEVLHKMEKALSEGIFPQQVISAEEYEIMEKEGFLSLKPMFYVANIGEEDLESPSSHLERFREFANRERLEVIEICAQLEAELAEFSDRKLNLITFFTITGGREVRAWAIKKGSPAVEAAGKVHSDMKRGFVRAEVIGVEELLDAGSFKRAKSEGKVRVEGREYRIKDGDVVHFLFT